MSIDPMKVESAARSGKPASYFLKDTRVIHTQNYAISGFFGRHSIPDEPGVVPPRKTPAEDFFSESVCEGFGMESASGVHLVVGFSLRDVLKEGGKDAMAIYGGRACLKEDFNIVVVNSHLVLEVFPRSSRTEYLVLGPLARSGSPEMDHLLGSQVSTLMIDCLMTRWTERLTPFLEMDCLLNQFWDTPRRKKLFGLF